MPQRVGITEIDPAYVALQHHGSQLAGLRMTDTQRVTSIDQVVFQRRDHAAAVEGFAQQQGTAVTGGALAAQFNTDSAVAVGRTGG